MTELDVIKQMFRGLFGFGNYEGENDIGEHIFSDDKGVWYVWDEETQDFIELTDY